MSGAATATRPWRRSRCSGWSTAPARAAWHSRPTISSRPPTASTKLDDISASRPPPIRSVRCTTRARASTSCSPATGGHSWPIARQWPRAPCSGSDALSDQLSDLHRVERRALQQVVADDEEVQRVRVVEVPADAADGRLVAARPLQRRGRFGYDEVGEAVERLERAFAADLLAERRAHGNRMADDDGTRTQVGVTSRSGMLRILRDSLSIFISSSV